MSGRSRPGAGAAPDVHDAADPSQFTVECANIEGGDPDPALPLTFSARVLATTTEFMELANQRGITMDTSESEDEPGAPRS